MPAISTCFWFDHQAEEAARFYVSLFEDAAILTVNRNAVDNPGGGKQGDVVAVTFHLQGTAYTAINGGPHFTLSPAASIVAACDTQEEVDRLWDALMEGGESMRCGWLTDRFGLSWQVVPAILYELLASDDPEVAKRTSRAMFDMVKFDIAALKAASAGD